MLQQLVEFCHAQVTHAVQLFERETSNFFADVPLHDERLALEFGLTGCDVKADEWCAGVLNHMLFVSHEIRPGFRLGWRGKGKRYRRDAKQRHGVSERHRCRGDFVGK